MRTSESTPGRTANDSAVPPSLPELAGLPAARGRQESGPASDADAGLAARSSDFVQSLDRGLAVIRAFGPDRERLSLSEVARATGLTRAAARRFLLTLVKLGYVRNDGREFSLRPRVLELGYAYLSGLALPEVAAPHMEELVARLHESSSISVLDGHHIVYVVRVPTKRIMTVAISVGTRFPAYATSMGRVLLAQLSDDELERYLAEATFERLTSRTVTNPARLRTIVRDAATARRPSSSSWSTIAYPCRADPRRRRRERGHQRVRPRQPGQHGRDAGADPAGAAGDGPPDRGGPAVRIPLEPVGTHGEDEKGAISTSS